MLVLLDRLPSSGPDTTGTVDCEFVVSVARLEPVLENEFDAVVEETRLCVVEIVDTERL